MYYAFPKTINTIFDEFFLDDYRSSTHKPKLDIHKTETEYLVNVELPGFEQKDIRVDIENNNLKITGERKSEKDEKRKTIHEEIKSYSKFERFVSLSNEVDTEKISAKINMGILNISLPLQEKSKSKQIEIKVS